MTGFTLNTPCKRQPTGPFDFGDEATIGAHTKRVGTTLINSDLHKDYGRFLGKCPHGSYIIGIKSPMGEIVGTEGFPTLEALKQVWQLD